MTKSQLLEKGLLYDGNRLKDLVRSVPISPSQLERAASHFPLSWRERKQNFNSKFLFPLTEPRFSSHFYLALGPPDEPLF
jgi:hypothetical protein